MLMSLYALEQGLQWKTLWMQQRELAQTARIVVCAGGSQVLLAGYVQGAPLKLSYPVHTAWKSRAQCIWSVELR